MPQISNPVSEMPSPSVSQLAEAETVPPAPSAVQVQVEGLPTHCASATNWSVINDRVGYGADFAWGCDLFDHRCQQRRRQDPPVGEDDGRLGLPELPGPDGAVQESRTG